MISANLALTAVFSILEGGMYAYIVNSLLCRDSSKYHTLANTVILAMTTSVVINLLSLPIYLKTVVAIFVLSTIVAITFKSDFVLSLFFTLCTFYIFVITDLFLANVVSAFSGETITHLLQATYGLHLIFAISSKLLQIVLVYLLVAKFKRITWNIPVRYWWVMNIVVALCFFIALSMAFLNNLALKSDISNKISLMSIAFILLSTLFIIQFSIITKFFQARALSYVTEKTDELLQEKIAAIAKEKDDMHKKNHSWNNMLATISALLKKERIVDAIKYIDELAGKKEEVFIQTQITNNVVLDAVLEVKNSDSASLYASINVSVQGNVETSEILPTELTTVFANMLDNAIEAVTSLPKEKREIMVKIFYHKEFLNIVVENYYSNRIKIRNGVIQTSKQEKMLHGYGIGINQEICTKYGGSFTVTYTKDYFVAHAVLQNKSSE